MRVKRIDNRKTVKLGNGFLLEKDDATDTFFYFKPGILCNRMSREGIASLLEPARSFVLAGVELLDR